MGIRCYLPQLVKFMPKLV
uniref:Uncharacterized protein n=1 Tax=Arundo donax TaxID=35708 RepID=A0A0A8ZWP2_ARUDO